MGDLLRWNDNLDDPALGGPDFARQMQEPGGWPVGGRRRTRWGWTWGYGTASRP